MLDSDNSEKYLFLKVPTICLPASQKTENPLRSLATGLYVNAYKG